jgi:hypothetical protein
VCFMSLRKRVSESRSVMFDLGSCIWVLARTSSIGCHSSDVIVAEFIEAFFTLVA